MQSFTFRELSLTAQANAMARYSEDQAIVELACELIQYGVDYEIPENIFFLANWRYTEHGERIA